MLYIVKWRRKPYYKFDNLNSINVNHNDNLLDISLYITDKKKYSYVIKAEDIKSIDFHIGYNNSSSKVVFIVIKYYKRNKEYQLSFYLPRNYDKAMIGDIEKFAQDRDIKFVRSKGINPLLFVITFIIIVYLIKYLVS